jgi:hypothetical protein
LNEDDKSDSSYEEEDGMGEEYKIPRFEDAEIF